MTSPYDQAIQSGHTDEQIIEHLSKKDPIFHEKYKKAIDLGYSLKDVANQVAARKSQPQENVFVDETINAEPKKELGNSNENIKEVIPQTLQGIGIGALGTYGDILDFLHLQPKETLPGESEKYNREFDVTQKMNSGERPSFSDLLELSSDDEIAPRYSRLPSSEQVKNVGEKSGLVSEPKTVSGRYGKRIGELAGSSAVTGRLALKASIIAGAAGQTLAEAGAPAWMQAAAEMVAFFKFSPKQKLPVSSKSKEVENVIDNLRKQGFSEKDITIAKNALEERNVLTKVASHTESSKKSIQDTLSNVEGNVDKILESTFPGFTTHGTDLVKKSAVEILDLVEESSKHVPIKNSKEFIKELNGMTENIKKTLANTPQEKQIIDYIETAAKTAESASQLTADYYVKFYRGLNAIGNWDNSKQREYVFSNVKEAVKRALKGQGEEGIELAKNLDKSNIAWMKYLDAEDVSKFIKKSMTEEGVNFNKLSKSLDSKVAYDALSESLGKTQTANLKSMADIGKQIGNLDKALSGDSAKKIFGTIKLWETAKAVIKMDYKSLGLIAGNEIAGKLASKILTEPKYQNLTKNMMQAAKDQKWQQVAIISKNLQEELEKENQNKSK